MAIELVVLILPPDLREWVIKENGPIENASVVGYLLAVCWLCITGFRRRSVQGYFLSALLVFSLALRELDFHERFTTMGIFKTLFYVSPKVPITEKIIVSTIVLTIFAALFWYVKKYGSGLIQALRRRENWAICITIAIALAGITKTLDGSSGGINECCLSFLHLNSATVAWVSEEVLELAIPLFILLAIYYTTLVGTAKSASTK